MNITEIAKQAHIAGMNAVNNLKVVPMLVGQAKSLFSDEIDMTKPTEYVADGVCGFAWIDIYPTHKGNTKDGKAERKLYESIGFTKDDYKKCYSLWVREFNQSMQKKETYATAYAAILQIHNIRAYSGSRMD